MTANYECSWGGSPHWLRKSQQTSEARIDEEIACLTTTDGEGSAQLRSQCRGGGELMLTELRLPRRLAGVMFWVVAALCLAGLVIRPPVYRFGRL